MKPISQGALGENPPRSHRSDHGPHRSTILLLHTKSLRIIETSIFSEGTSSRHSVFRNPSKSQLFAFFFLFHTACLGLLNAEFPFNRTANNKNIPKTFSIPKKHGVAAEISQVEELITMFSNDQPPTLKCRG